ncbi:MAG: DMT family transporter [Pseudomonadales bacterium]|nr:DMT family transporter [Pseudomonadales bacterium]
MDKTLISLLGGLTAMIGWGTSDFFANEASDKVGHIKALFFSQLAGLILIGLATIFFAKNLILSPMLGFLIILSGITYTFGYLLFYKAFEIGNVSIVSAVINFQNIFIIFISYFLFGQSLTTYQIPAIILILSGTTLVSINFNDLKKGNVSLVKGVKETLLATIMFGIFFWPLNEYVSERADWILVSFLTKLVAILTLLIISFAKKQKLTLIKPNNRLKLVLLAVGLLEAIAILGMSFGVAFGDMIIVSPIASSLTVVTVGLAIIFLKEKLTKSQGLGIIITIIGIISTAF